MAILKMKQIEVVALQSDAKSIIEFLQRTGAVEIKQRPDVSGTSSIGQSPESSGTRGSGPDEALIQLHTHASITYFDKTLQLVNMSLAVLDAYDPVKKSFLSSFSGRRELTLSAFSERSHKVEETLRKAREIAALSQKIESEDVTISHTRSRLEAVLPWEDLNIPMQFPGTVHTAAIIGSIPALYTEETLLDALQDTAATEDEAAEFPPVSITIVSSSREMTCIAVICHRSDENIVRGTLRKIGLAIPSDPTNHPPSVRIERLKKRIAFAQEERADAVRQLAGYKNDRDSLEFLSDYYLMRKDKYEAIGKLLFSSKTFILEGYIPERDAAALEEALVTRFDVSVTFEDTKEDDEEVPVLLQNNPLVTPVEDIVSSYSLPSKQDVDPNPAMAFFYYLFFGMMLSDAGYGVLLVISTLAILRFLKPEGSMKVNMQKFCLCGLSTIFWGALFGSWFGNAVYVISTTFLGKNISLNPIWFDPVTNPLNLLILSLILGFVHIMTGLGLRFYNMWRHGEKIDALFDIGMWWVVFAGLGLVIANMVIAAPIPLGTIGLWTAAAGGLGLLLTQGRSSKSVPGKIIGGIASLYSITGYFSDILSYSRLMALGLVTGIIGTVVNTIGSISGGGIFGVLIFIPVFIFGHAINIGINALGAYVHCNRLQYVEFFSKFYEGGGKPFKPFGINTKRFKFKEDR